MAVVKADGYGHGAVPVARAALEAGATWLGVALVEEGVELRDAGIDAPILVLSEPRAGGRGRGRRAPADARSSTPTAGIDALAKAVVDRRRRRPARACTSRSTPGCTGSAPRPTTRSRSRGGSSERTELRLGGVLHAPRGGRRARRPVHGEQLARFARRARRPRGGRAAAAARARGELGRAARRSPTPASTSCGSGSRSTASRRCPSSPDRADAAARAVAQGAGLAREDARRRRPPLLRAALRARRATARIATVPIGYADGVPAQPRARSAARSWSAGAGVRSPAR